MHSGPDSKSCAWALEPRSVNGVTILGPDLFCRGGDEKLCSPIASVFPNHGLIVTVKGIHALHAVIAAEFLGRRMGEESAAESVVDSVYCDAVALLIRNSSVLIRSDLENMDRIFAADEILQRVVPKGCIQFTGVHLEEVRKQLRKQGESWRISPSPRSVDEIIHYIQASQVHVHTGATYYYNAPRGGRFLTYEEFLRIRPLLRNDPKEALARLREIALLTRMVNNQGARELSFFLPPGKDLPREGLADLVRLIEKASDPRDCEEAEGLFDEFAAAFAAEAGSELIEDGPEYVGWRTAMFCRLYDINEEVMEEWALGLSPEFHLNVKWAPGASIRGENITFDPGAPPRIRSLIAHFWEKWLGVDSINAGLIESSQTNRERADENREVYLVVLGRAGGGEDIRHLRMVKWDVMHRIERGVPQNQAVIETLQYRQYVFDRLRAASELGIPIPSFDEISFMEDLPGLGPIPVFFYDRRYFPGMATDKIPPARLSEPQFIVRLARFLGQAAAVDLTLGRASPRSGHVFFDDGDEVLQIGEDGLPDGLVMVETTGSFTDWNSPMAKLLPHCLEHLAEHLKKAGAKGVGPEHLREAVLRFETGFVSEVERMKELVRNNAARLWSLFADRTAEPGGIRSRWEGVLKRLESTDVGELSRLIAEDPRLGEFRMQESEIRAMAKEPGASEGRRGDECG